MTPPKQSAKQRVLEVYPKAICFLDYFCGMFKIAYSKDASKTNVGEPSPRQAWANAAANLPRSKR